MLNLLIYAIASDSRLQTEVERTIEDMRAALRTDRCRIGVQLNGRRAMSRHWIEAGDVETLLGPAVDAGESSSLTEFLDAANARWTDARTALFLWAHGGVQNENACPLGPDPATGNYLTNVEVRTAIAQSAREEVDLLGLNACGMGMIEVGHELGPVSRVAIASQVFAKAWPYGEIVQSLSSRAGLDSQSSPEMILAGAVVASIQSAIAAGHRQDPVCALLTGRERMDDLKTALDVYSRRLSALIASPYASTLVSEIGAVHSLDDPYLADLCSLVSTLGQGDDAARGAGEEVLRRYRAMRIAAAVSPIYPGIGGLSILFPRTRAWDVRASYRETSFAGSHWESFLVALQDKLFPPPVS